MYYYYNKYKLLRILYATHYLQTFRNVWKLSIMLFCISYYDISEGKQQKLIRQIKF